MPCWNAGRLSDGEPAWREGGSELKTREKCDMCIKGVQVMVLDLSSAVWNLSLHLHSVADDGVEDQTSDQTFVSRLAAGSHGRVMTAIKKKLG